MPTWGTASDWNNAQSQNLGHHEQPTGQDWAVSDKYEGGYPTSIPSFSSNLIAYFPMAETSGSTAYEVTGTQSSNGTYQNAPTLADDSGAFGSNSPRYQPSNNEYVDSGTNFSQSDDSFAMCCWFQHTTSWSTNYENIMNDWDGSSNSWAVQRNRGNSELNLNINGNVTATVSDSGFLDLMWHWAYAHQDVNNSEQVLRLDDTSSTTSGTAYSMSATSKNHSIAAGPAQNFWDGWIQHVAIFDGPLTTAEQDLLRNAPL